MQVVTNVIFVFVFINEFTNFIESNYIRYLSSANP
ncbi:MAG: hypothetical protein RL023_721 [Candidatus Parcubacteria bacterium]